MSIFKVAFPTELSGEFLKGFDIYNEIYKIYVPI